MNRSIDIKKILFYFKLSLGIIILSLSFFLICFKSFADVEFFDVKSDYTDISTGKNINLYVELKTDKDINGSIAFFLSDGEGNEYKYKYDIYCKADEVYEKEIILYIPKNTKRIIAQLFDGNTLIENKELKIINDSTTSYLFIGILSNNPDMLSYFSDISMNYSLLKSKNINFDEKSFPTDFKALEQLDIIIVSDFKLKSLSDKQFKALNNWVKKGGVLLLGTGRAIDDVLGRYAPELLDSMYDEVSVANIYPASNFEGIDNYMSINIEVANLKLKGGNILSYDRVPLISEVKKENGKIVVCSYDLTKLGDYVYYNHQFGRGFIYKLMDDNTISSMSEINNYSDDSNWEITELTRNGEWQNIISIKFYIILTIIYIMLIGPILFIFLRKNNISTFYRAAVFLSSMIFTVLIYTAGSASRFVDTIYNYATIYEVEYNETNEVSYVDVKSPESETYNVNFNKNYYITPINDMNIGGYGNNKLVIHEEDVGTKITFMNPPTFKSYYLKMDRNIDNNLGIDIKSDIRFGESGLNGTVRNLSGIKLNNAIIVAYGRLIMLGDILPNESVRLDDLEAHIIPTYDYYSVAQKIFEQEDNKDNDYNQYSRSSNKIYILSYYMKYFLNEYNGDSRILAFVDKLNDDDIINDNIAGNGYNLLSYRINIDNNINGNIYRSISMINPTVLSGDYDYENNSIYSDGTTILKYRIGNDIEVKKIQIEQFSNKFFEDHRNLKIYLFNLDTEEYDEVTYEDFVLSGNNLFKYLNSSNEIIFRFTSVLNEDTYIRTCLPFISVTGRSID